MVSQAATNMHLIVTFTVIEKGAPKEETPIYDKLVNDTSRVDESVQSSVELSTYREVLQRVGEVAARWADALSSLEIRSEPDH